MKGIFIKKRKKKQKKHFVFSKKALAWLENSQSWFIDLGFKLHLYGATVVMMSFNPHMGGGIVSR